MLLLFVAISAIVQPHIPIATAEQTTTALTLYAHTDPSATSVGGRVLSILGNSTSHNSADVRDGLDFTLVPSLSNSLRLLGGISVRVWLLSHQSVRGTLTVGISEVAANASVTEIRSASVTVGLPSNVNYNVQFGLGPVDYEVRAGSTLRFSVQFTSTTGVPVMLLWDDPFVSTRLVLHVESIPRISLKITDSSGKASTIFPENATGPVKLVAEVSVEDPFHGINVRMVSLNVTNSTRFDLITNATMNLTSTVEFPFRLDYALPMHVPSGLFNVTVGVRDLAGRTFVTTRQIAVTPFYELILMVVDPQRRPLPSLNVSLYAGDQLIDQGVTNSSGTTVTRVPSSRVVGPTTVTIWSKGTLILSSPVDLTSDSVLQLTAEVYDWNIAVRLSTLGLPVPSATVSLHLNATLVASSVSDASGIAHFDSIPLRAYEITITSPLASGRFLNVTHSAEPSVTVLELQIPPSVLLMVAGLAILVASGVFVTTRYRMRRRRFENVAQLLGGSIPRSAVMMVVGPSGTGRSLLLQNILADAIEAGHACVYVSNSELPSKIREQLSRLGIKVQACEDQNRLRFIDAYSGEAGAVSREKHFVSSLKDLTTLGIQLTSCIEELGGVADVFFDLITPIVVSGDSERGFDFVRYYGARTTKPGGSFFYVATTTIDPTTLGRFEEASDCVLQVEKATGAGKIRGRLLVKKARGLEHERDWVGFKITSKGRIEFVSLPAEKR